MSGYVDMMARVWQLKEERPDLLPLLRRVQEAGGEGWFDDEDREGLEELVRRGLLARSFPADDYDERPAGHGREA